MIVENNGQVTHERATEEQKYIAFIETKDIGDLVLVFRNKDNARLFMYSFLDNMNLETSLILGEHSTIDEALTVYEFLGLGTGNECNKPEAIIYNDTMFVTFSNIEDLYNNDYEYADDDNVITLSITYADKVSVFDFIEADTESESNGRHMDLSAYAWLNEEEE